MASKRGIAGQRYEVHTWIDKTASLETVTETSSLHVAERTFTDAVRSDRYDVVSILTSNCDVIREFLRPVPVS
jgi:hypothetical protein